MDGGCRVRGSVGAWHKFASRRQAGDGCRFRATCFKLAGRGVRGVPPRNL